MRKQHELSISSSDAVELLSTFHQFALYDKLSLAPNTVVPAIEGLEPMLVYTCLLCPAAYAKLDSMQKHHRTHHPKDPRPETWPQSMGQQQNRSTANSWFRVSTMEFRPPRTPSAELVAQIENSMQATLPIDIGALDARNVTPWLRVTQWHLHTKGYAAADLQKMVAYPTVGELPHLKMAVQAFWESASQLIDATSVLVLQKLNSPYIEKTYVIFYFNCSVRRTVQLIFFLPVESPTLPSITFKIMIEGEIPIFPPLLD
jgi:hypothetical protein